MVSRGSTVPDLDETIVALSSAPGPGLRAIVRLSGRTAFSLAKTIALDFEPDPFVRRQAVSVGLELAGLASRLPADLFVFRAPATYTGQDLVEIHTISSPPLVDLLISQLLQAGGRAAQPGEFTMRAFLAGKLDLTRAEAVHAVVEAEDPAQLRHALTQLAGGIARPLDALRDDLLNLLADVEAGLDFADEDLHFVNPTEMLQRLTRALAQVTLVSRQIDERGSHRRGVRVVLAGPPNAGKSSLFNSLLGRPAALVGEQPGTTRDYLEADLKLGDIVVHLVDTAGLGVATGAIDAEAQSLGRTQAGQAELVLWCLERGGQASLPPSGRPLKIATKADLGPCPPDWLAVSAQKGTGLDELRARLREEAKVLAASPLASSLGRCRHHVTACLEHLRHAHSVVLQQEPPELLALQLRLALDELGAVVGAVYTDDLLDRIFSRFCIGK